MYQVRLFNLYGQSDPNTFRVLVVKFVKKLTNVSLTDALHFAKGEKVLTVDEDTFKQLGEFFGPVMQYRMDEWQSF